MKQHKINTLKNFISGWYIKKSICDDLINLFESSSLKKDGVVCHDKIDKSIKHSTDISIPQLNNNIIIQNYLSELHKVINKYKKLYIYSDKNQGNWEITEKFNIQRYYPNQGFYKYHTERCTIDSSLRHLTFMTYLNDVTDCGETEFYYQNIKIKPEKGLTIIWGTDWTFTHRGIPSPTQTKYIATGWYSYV